MHRADTSYIWKVRTPIQSEVALTKETKETHIEGDHCDDLVRMHAFGMLPEIIAQPRFIYMDQQHEINKRLHYCDLVAIPEVGHLSNLIIVVDTDRIPHEVVTWMVKSNSKQEKFDEGRILYDSRADKQSTI